MTTDQIKRGLGASLLHDTKNAILLKEYNEVVQLNSKKQNEIKDTHK